VSSGSSEEDLVSSRAGARARLELCNWEWGKMGGQLNSCPFSDSGVSDFVACLE